MDCSSYSAVTSSCVALVKNGFNLSSSPSLVMYLSCDLENHFSLEL